MVGEIYSNGKDITGEEFIEYILGGETNFSNVKLVGNKNLNESKNFSDLNCFLKEDYLKNLPQINNRIESYKYYLQFENSDFSGIEASNLYFPQSLIVKSNFRNSNLPGLIMNGSKIESSSFSNSNLSFSQFNNAQFIKESCFNHVDFSNSSLYNLKTEKVSMIKSNFLEALLSSSYLNGNFACSNFSRSIFDDSKIQSSSFLASNFNFAQVNSGTFFRAALFRNAIGLETIGKLSESEFDLFNIISKNMENFFICLSEEKISKERFSIKENSEKKRFKGFTFCKLGDKKDRITNFVIASDKLGVDLNEQVERMILDAESFRF